MIAGQAADGRAFQRGRFGQDARETPVACGFAVLRQVARGEQQVGMLAVGFDLAQHGAQACVGIDAQHRRFGFAEKMAIGQLDEHRGRVVAPGQGVDACHVPLLQKFA